jgi:uncharacterized protein (TIGR00369 family)
VEATVSSGTDLIRQWLEASPFVQTLGVTTEKLDPGLAVLTLPFDPSLATIGDVIHGGAISSLVDTAAAAASWAGVETPESVRGTTVGISVTFVSAARGQDVTATARVARRGKSLAFVDVDVVTADGSLVAKALVTYKLG